MYRFVLPALCLVVGSAALSADNGYRAKQEAQDQADLAKALDGFTPGPARSCIQPTRIHDTQRVGDTILYKYSPKEIYRTDTGGGCFGLRQGDTIVTKSYTGEFCRGDIIHTVDLVSRFPSGSCTFGDFIPYRK